MKYLVIMLCLIGVTGINTGCQSNKPLNQLPNFDFKTWKHEVLHQFDSLTIANNQLFLKYGPNVPKSLRFEIENIEEDQFIKAFNHVLNKNKIKKWDKFYLIYNFYESTAYMNLISFIFVHQDNNWAILYDLNLNKFYKVTNFVEKDIDDMKTLVFVSDNVVIISKFDRQFNNNINEILIGVPFSDFKPVLDLYYERH